MDASREDEVTALLQEWTQGNRAALDRLMPLVYDELRRLAHRHLRRERAHHTLTTTALVHDAYLNLVDQTRARWQNRAHFFAIAARCMRRILLQYARRRAAVKRWGGQVKVPLDDAMAAAESRARELIDLDQALQQLEAMDARLGNVVTLRYFGGLTVEETAEALDLSPATVKRDWRTARAWLHRTLSRDR